MLIFLNKQTFIFVSFWLQLLKHSVFLTVGKHLYWGRARVLVPPPAGYVSNLKSLFGGLFEQYLLKTGYTLESSALANCLFSVSIILCMDVRTYLYLIMVSYFYYKITKFFAFKSGSDVKCKFFKSLHKLEHKI